MLLTNFAESRGRGFFAVNVLTMRIKSGFSGERSLVLPKVIIENMENDVLTSLLHITDIGYYPKASHHYRRRNPPIGQYVFIYCIDGSGWFELNGVRYDVCANQYFILPAGVPHTYASSDSDPWTIYWAHFGGSEARHFMPADHAPQTIAPGDDSRIENRISLFEEIFNTLNDSFAIENIRYATSAFHHFLESMRYFRLYRKAGNRKHDADVIESTIHFMGENLERRLTLHEVADYAGLSPSFLSAKFKNRTGYGPLAYFNMMKVRKACELLDTTPMKLNQISSKLGFEDQFYFSRLFSKIMGMAPSAYRGRQKA